MCSLDLGKLATDSVEGLDLYAATLEIDSFLDESRHGDIASRVAHDWEGIRGGDERTIDEAKLGLVYRFGDAVRAVAEPSRPRPQRARPRLWGTARNGARRADRTQSASPSRRKSERAVTQLSGLCASHVHNAHGNTWKNAAWPNGTANGGGPSGSNGQSGNPDKNRALRGRTLCAWLTPLLAGSVDECKDEARQELGSSLDRVGRDQQDGGNYFHLSLEVALAQGFKYAANRRFGRTPHALPATRDYMAEQAIEGFRKARFWFTRLTLIHALCLWEMPDPRISADDEPGHRDNGSDAAGSQVHRPGSDPKATVAHWLELARNGKHPFVAEAGKLAVEALKTRHPERFLWIDESGVVSSVGPRAAGQPRKGRPVLDPAIARLGGTGPARSATRRRRTPGREPGRARGRGRTRSSSTSGASRSNDLQLCFTSNRDPLRPGNDDRRPGEARGRNCIDEFPTPPVPLPPYEVGPPGTSQTYAPRSAAPVERGVCRLHGKRYARQA